MDVYIFVEGVIEVIFMGKELICSDLVISEQYPGVF